MLALFDTKGYQHVCIASSICETGDLFFSIQDFSFKGDGIVNYLKELLAHTSRKILLVWDNASWHKSDETIAFLRSKEGERLWVARTLPHKILPSVFTASEGTFEAPDFSPSSD